jgi:DNA-binding protein Fis
METPADEDLQALISVLSSAPASGQADLYRRALEYFDRIIICRAMDQSGGNLTKAAELLGLSRVTLRTKLRAIRRTNEKEIAPQIESECRAAGMINPS